MIRARYIVADRLRRVPTEEHRAGMTHAGGQGFGIGNRELQMLRRQAIDQGWRLVE